MRDIKNSQTKNRRKSRESKFRHISLSRRSKAIVAIIALLALIFTVGKIEAYFSAYSGLGAQADIPANAYEYALSLTYDEEGWLHYEDEKYISLQGIDVSAYQKEIDWKKVKEAGAEFAMIRLGYRGYLDGSLQMDSYYEANISGAHSAGIKVGVYFVSQATSVEEAVEEAKFVLKQIRGKHVTCPVAFDMEPVAEGEKIATLTSEERTVIADAFCDIIEKNGYTPVIYGNPTWFTNYVDISYLTERNFWLAHYTYQTDYPYAHVMWQYTEKGKIDGIEGYVDLNLWMVEKSKYYAMK